ncbi:MAG TPA: response regulator [Bacteroidia bacterium]|nr:response regulator [Bacteroidia bacterium]
MKVLIADDSPLIVQRLREMISSLEFVTAIGHAVDGRETLVLAEFMKPDVIILDITMPGINGLQVLDELKKNSSGVRVILFTNHSDEYLKHFCLQRGADFFLDKSADFEQIPHLLSFQYPNSAVS